MKREKAIYISTKLISEAYKTYETVVGNPYNLYISAGIEVLKLFSNVATSIVNHKLVKAEEEKELSELKHRVLLDEANLSSEFNLINEDIKDAETQENHYRRIAATLSDDIASIVEFLGDIKTDNYSEIQEYERKAIRSYKNIIKNIV